MASINFEASFKKVLKAGKSRNYKLAINLLEEMAAQGLAEKHPEIFLYLARSHHSLQDYSKAISIFRAYAKLKPKDPAGWFFLGRTYFTVEAYEQAVFALRKSLSLNPESIDANVVLGYSYLKAKKPVLSREVFEEALYSFPDDERLNQGYLNSLFVEAVRIYRQGHTDLARQMLTFLINNDIDGVVPRLYLGHTLRDLGYLNEALEQYNDALSFSPNDLALKWYPISILMQQGKMQNALEIMQGYGLSSFIPEPNAPAIAFEIIKNHIDQEKWQEAVDACRSFIRTYGDNAQVQSLMAEGFRNINNNRLSLVHFNRALKLDKKDLSPYYGILMVYIGEQDWENVELTVQKAVKAGCSLDELSLYSILARANLDTNPEILLPEIQEEIRKSGAVPDLLIALAQTYFKIGLFDLSIGWYQKSIEINPENELAWLGYLSSCEQLLDESNDDKKDLKFYREEITKAFDGYIKRWNDNITIVKEAVEFFASIENWLKASEYAELLLTRENSDGLERKLAFFKRKSGQYRFAAILYRKQLREHPKDRNLLVNLVFCLNKMNETKLAFELINKANKVFSPNADFFLIEGRLLDKLGKEEDALNLYRKAIDVFPKDPRCWEEIANAYKKQGIHEMATNFYQKAEELKSKKNN